MELDDVADDASMPVGSMLAFCRQGDAVVVTDLGAVAVLRPEFVGRLKAVASARAIVEGYRGEHPIVRLVS